MTGPEFDDLVEQATDDALVNVLARLDDFEGRSRFTTWAYKLVISEVSAIVAAHAWRRQPPGLPGFAPELVPDAASIAPPERLEQRSRLDVLRMAIGELTERQRVVFVSAALNEVPIDVLALRLHSNPNAIYKNLFDARRSLRGKLAAAGFAVGDEPSGR